MQELREQAVVPADLGVTARLWTFSALSLALLVALSVAPLRGHRSEWRAAQHRYNALAGAAGVEPVEVSIKQLWKPDLGVVDRCVSCHLGMGPAEPIASDPLFRAHPPIPHEPDEFGCTVCHAGQGRATSKDAAHGQVRHWDEPMLPREHVQAGCGTCHSHVRVPAPALADAGRRLVEQNACLDCHRIDGRGRGDGPDLSGVGLAGFRADWHDRHAAEAARAPQGPWSTSFRPLPDEEVAAAGEYLRALIAAPRLMAGKALAHRLGCRGCHRIAGTGGDDGPDLTDVGRKPAADLDFSRVRGPRTTAAWLRDHFLDPPRVVSGSAMPDLGLTGEQADLLATYMLSLRARPIPESVAPRDRVRGARLGEREFAADGEALYGVFCAACHGARGSGRRFGTLEPTFPAIGDPEFLAIAGDDLLRRTLTGGRPGRRMPAWGSKDGGLRPEEIEAIVRYLRSLEPPPPSWEQVRGAPADAVLGRRLFARDCAACHGAAGEGSAIGPPLAAPDNPATREDSRVYGTLASGVAGTAMGSFRRYSPAETRAVIAAVRALAPVPEASRRSWKPRPGDAARGAALYAGHCGGCHGARGEGRTGPALANAALLAAAGDAYLAATTVRGRGGTAMPHFGSPGSTHLVLSAAEVADVVAHLRSFAGPQGASHAP